MMLYLKLDDKGEGEYILNEDQIRNELNHVILPAEITQESISPYGYALLEPVMPPEGLVEDMWHKYDVSWIKQEDGSFKRELFLAPVNEEDITPRYELRKREIRKERNDRIKATDWTQLADVQETVREAYIEYRQALRDVPEQEGFPFDVKWPTEPNVT